MPDHPLYQEYQSHNIQDYITKLNEEISNKIKEDLQNITEVFIKDTPELESAIEESQQSGEIVLVNAPPIKESTIAPDSIDLFNLSDEQMKELEESVKRYKTNT